MDFYDCPFCQKRSYNQNDVLQKFCGNCNRFSNDVIGMIDDFFKSEDNHIHNLPVNDTNCLHYWIMDDNGVPVRPETIKQVSSFITSGKYVISEDRLNGFCIFTMFNVLDCEFKTFVYALSTGETVDYYKNDKIEEAKETHQELVLNYKESGQND